MVQDGKRHGTLQKKGRDVAQEKIDSSHEPGEELKNVVSERAKNRWGGEGSRKLEFKTSGLEGKNV